MSAKSIHSRLNVVMHDSMQFSRSNNKCQVILELFSGTNSFSRIGKSKGWGCVSIDIVHGDHHDLTNPTVQRIIRSWIHSGLVWVIWLGTPCNSWSRARHDINGGGPRSNDHIWGLPPDQLSPADQLRIALGNATLKFSCSIVRMCRKYKIPCCLENPASSLIWKAPPLRILSSLGSIATSDFCQYGKPWRKRTNVCTWNVDPGELVTNTCKGRGGVCSRTHKKHIVLKGLHPTRHIPWTKVAEPYPSPWVKAWWACLENSSFNLDASRRFLGF